jgi:hypothetical protein
MKLNNDIKQGIITLDLIDTQTNKTIQTVKTENFISNQAKKILKHITKFNVLRSGYSPFGHTIATPPVPFTSVFTNRYAQICDLFGTICLTDDDSAEDSATEMFAQGNIIGFANLQAYSGTSTKRGVLNFSNCEFTESSIKYVFDFSNSVANGTIKSIGFMMVNPDLETWGNHVPVLSNVFTVPRSSTWKGLAFADDWTVHAIEYVSTSLSRMIEMDLLRYEVVSARTFTFGHSCQYETGLAWDGVYYYTCNDRTTADLRRIFKYDYNGNLVLSLETAAATVARGISVDDTYVYLIVGNTIRRYNKTTLVLVDSFDKAADVISGSTAFAVIGASEQGNVIVANPTMTEILIYDATDMSLVQRLDSPTVGGTCTGGDVKGGLVFGQPGSGTSWYARPYRTLHTRSLLPVPITKNSLHNLRLTYEFEL